MYIEFLTCSPHRELRLKDLRNIFLLSAKRQFSTDSEREGFYNTWVTPYLENWPEEVLFTCDLDSQKTLGYLTGCRNSLEAEPLLSKNIRSYSVFSDLFKKFPAHLHMNCRPESRGQGAGSFLLQEYLIELKRNKVPGVHIITSPNERNVDFYYRNKFTYQEERKFGEFPLLFMGLRF